jgi:hyperosmotically inducible protein
MKNVLIIIAVTLSTVACDSAGRRSPDRAAGSGNTATSPDGSRPDAAPSDRAPTLANDRSTAERTRDADQAGINDLNRRATTTPLDQGSTVAEANITASIRKGIMADDLLSSAGTTVKVTTVGSKVTLRGPVKSDQAKVAIAAIATRTAGVREVDNQLEVTN